MSSPSKPSSPAPSTSTIRSPVPADDEDNFIESGLLIRSRDNAFDNTNVVNSRHASNKFIDGLSAVCQSVASLLHKYKLIRYTLQTLVTLCHVSLLLYLLRTTTFSVQQSALRCMVKSASQALAPSPSPAAPIEYWWDFGTLLGLVREHDIISNEVDADMSMTAESRALLDQPRYRDALTSHGFREFEARDGDGKMRIKHRYGWFIDLDVWKNTTEILHNPNLDRHHDKEQRRMQMVTGRHDPAMYSLPIDWFMPLQTFELPMVTEAECNDDAVADETPLHSHIDQTEHQRAMTLSAEVEPRLDDTQETGVSLSIPNQPWKLTKYWYGKSYFFPRKYNKGRDFTSDKREIILQRYAMFAFELFLACKVIVRLAINLWRHNSIPALLTATIAMPLLATIQLWKRASSLFSSKIGNSLSLHPSSPIISFLTFTWLDATTILCSIVLLNISSLDVRVAVLMGAVVPLLVVSLALVVARSASALWRRCHIRSLH